GHAELAMGAIALGGIRVMNEELVRALGLSPEIIQEAVHTEQHELERRNRVYRDDRPERDLHDQTIIVIDDGLATGASMRAAGAALRVRDPSRIVVATPVASTDAHNDLASEVEELVCAATPEPFLGVGIWYEDFVQVTDDEVRTILEKAWRDEAVGAT